MDFVILNHSQVTTTTPELAASHSPNYHITPKGELWAWTDLSTIINSSTWWVFSGTKARTHRIRWPQICDHKL
ncbi:hypothetical protein TNCV_3035361 [Trichonephila clavipes]|nr:hypothetical protein TNCV_3035361 [Trichonephila clavipes]